MWVSKNTKAAIVCWIIAGAKIALAILAVVIVGISFLLLSEPATPP